MVACGSNEGTSSTDSNAVPSTETGSASGAESDGGETAKMPLTANAYEDSIRYQNDSDVFTADGLVADQDRQDGITDIFKNGWTATQKGATITFEVEGSCVGIQYRKTIKLPAPVAEVVIASGK